MTEITLTSDITVRQVQSMGGDFMVVAAAKVSVSGEAAMQYASPESTENNYGLIRYLMKHRHGTPFEHSALTFFVHAPIFVWREWHRHRIGFSYNEESARYKTLDPVFYLPPRDRPMMKVDGWKPGRPKFMTLDEYAKTSPQCNKCKSEGEVPSRFSNAVVSCSRCGGNGFFDADGEYKAICERLQYAYRHAYIAYEENLRCGFDPGLARDCLPVGIYSSCWVTCNPRSLMAFLTLRTYDEAAKYVSYPLYEIEVAARQCEKMLEMGWPLVYRAFVECGRVGP